MDLVHPQLSAFTAVLEEGSFEAAARRLSISPSALSQRIKALEDRLGQVLVVRQAPCRPTAAGEVLLRRVRPMQALQTEALAELLPERGSDATRTPIPLAVNDDSLDTWFVAAIAELHQRHGYLFDLRMDDQDHTLELLRSGSVLGAVTAERRPLKGCNVHPLGAMRYRAIASPAFARRHFSAGMQAEALASAPMIVFNRKDELQWRFLRRLTRANATARTLPALLHRLRRCCRAWAGLVPGAGGPGHASGRVRADSGAGTASLARRTLVLAACRRALEHVATHHPRAAYRRGQYPTLKRA